MMGFQMWELGKICNNTLQRCLMEIVVIKFMPIGDIH